MTNLKGYLDDSGDDSVFVLAGFVASEEEWAKFSAAWKAALEAKPSIKFLKTKDAMAPTSTGEFYRMDTESRNAKLALLYSIIDEFIFFEVSIAILLEPFRKIFGDKSLPSHLRNPYYHALPMLIGQVTGHQIKIGMPEKIDFIFDEQVMEQNKILKIWEEAVSNCPDHVKAMLGETPSFKNDLEVLPLQAADMEAWWLRQRWREKLKGLERREYPWFPEPIPGIKVVFDEENLRLAYKLIVEANA